MSHVSQHSEKYFQQTEFLEYLYLYSCFLSCDDFCIMNHPCICIVYSTIYVHMLIALLQPYSSTYSHLKALRCSYLISQPHIFCNGLIFSTAQCIWNSCTGGLASHMGSASIILFTGILTRARAPTNPSVRCLDVKNRPYKGRGTDVLHTCTESADIILLITQSENSK